MEEFVAGLFKWLTDSGAPYGVVIFAFGFPAAIILYVWRSKQNTESDAVRQRVATDTAVARDRVAIEERQESFDRQAKIVAALVAEIARLQAENERLTDDRNDGWNGGRAAWDIAYSRGRTLTIMGAVGFPPLPPLEILARPPKEKP